MATRLHVIQGTPKPDTPAEKVSKRLRAASRPASMLQCPRCAGREGIETRIGALFKDGRITGGTRALICATCHAKGERVVLT